MNRFSKSLICTVAAALLVACGGKDAPAPTPTPEVGTALELKEKPEASISVLDAKGKAAGDEVVVVGRVSDITKGFAAFTLTDDSVAYCGRGEEECGCPTPWDYCCAEEEAKAGRMPVEMRDAKGEPVAVAETGLRLLDLVMVRGKLAKTESGGLMVVTTDGWYRAERPVLPDGLTWPK